MSYPLIQQPAPLQQLADVLGAIRAGREARIAQQEEMRVARARDARAERYLQLQEAQHANTIQQQAVTNQLNQADLGLRQMDAATRRRMEEFARATTLRERYIAERIPAVLRERVGGIGGVIDANQATQANAAILGAAAPLMGTAGQLAAQAASGAPQIDLTQQFQQAMSRSSEGRAGSIVRAPQIGVSDYGVSFVPERPNINLPSGGGGGGARTDNPQNLRDANLAALGEVTMYLRNAEDSDYQSAVRPWGSTVMRAGARMFARATGDDELSEAVSALGRTPEQRNYWGAAEQWAHNYIPNLPGFRMSVPMFHSVQRAFFAPPGESNPEVIRSFRNRREAVTSELLRFRARGSSDPEVLNMVVTRLRQFGATDVADEVLRAAQGANATPDGVDTPTMRGEAGEGTRVPQLNPRFSGQ